MSQDSSRPAPLKRCKTLVLTDIDKVTVAVDKAMDEVVYDKTQDVYPDNQKLVDSLVAMLQTRRLNAAVLLTVFEELESLPHVPIKKPSNARELAIEHHIAMDVFHEVTDKAHDKTRNSFAKTPWDFHSQGNFMVLDGQAIQDNGTVIADGCGICDVVKTECLDVATHFGKRGESPPDSTCETCGVGFGNRYDSARDLVLHVSKKHAETKGAK